MTLIDSTHEALAKGIITLARPSVPDTFWFTDHRIQAALNVLGMTVAEAWDWVDYSTDGRGHEV